MLSLVFAAVLAAQTPAPAAFAGAWNLEITDSGDSFASGGLRVDVTNAVVAAGLVWRWGSFAPVKSAEVKDGVLRLVREEKPGQAEVFEARLEGGQLKGRASYPDGKVHHFVGRRAPALAARKVPAWADPIRLFDGVSLAGWRLRDPRAKNGWAAVNGELAVVEPKGNADLVSSVAFLDAKLRLEFAVDPKSNSGVYLRGRYEVQILDNPDERTGLGAQGCGAVYSRLAPRRSAARAAGEWQTLDVTMIGRQITVVLNGIEIVSDSVDGITGGAIDPYEDRPGPLMLQGDHGKVRFRNIVLTPARR